MTREKTDRESLDEVTRELGDLSNDSPWDSSSIAELKLIRLFLLCRLASCGAIRRIEELGYIQFYDRVFTLSDRADIALRWLGGRGRVNEVIEEMKLFGLKERERPGQDWYGAVYAAIATHPDRFRKVSRGIWEVIPMPPSPHFGGNGAP